MSSPAKISANRENARKSTGPRSERGKSKSRLNALKFGIHATIPVLPGEDAGAYREIERANLTHFAPVGPVEKTLVRQIITEEWRLARIQKAENGLHERVIEEQIMRLLESLNDVEMAYVSSTYADVLSNEIAQAHRGKEAASSVLELQYPAAGRLGPPERSDDELQDGVEASLSRILAHENILHDCLIPNTERAPDPYLDNTRRVTVRAYLFYVSELEDFQKARLTVTQSPRSLPTGFSDLT
jgi:hypothetical protein